MTIQQMFLSAPRTFALDFITASGSGTDLAGTSIWTPPTDAAIGDLEILFHIGNDDDSEFLDNGDIPAGAGFTSLYTNPGGVDGSTSNRHSVIVTRRILTDKNAQTFVNPGLDRRMFIGVYFRPTETIATYNLSTVNFQATANDPTSQTVTASSGQTPLVVFGVASSLVAAGATTFSTTSPNFDGTFFDGSTGLTGLNTIVGWKIYNSSPVNHTIDKGDQGTNMLMSFYLSVSK